MNKKKEFSHLFYQGVLRTALALVSYNKALGDKEASLEVTYQIAIKESKATLKAVSISNTADPEVVISTANLMIGTAETLAEYYEKIGNNRLLQINTKQHKDKFISQSSRIFRSVLKSIDKDRAEDESSVQILSLMHYQLKCQKN